MSFRGRKTLAGPPSAAYRGGFMRAATDPISELRRAIDRLPTTTREAMLEGIRSNPIIAGAYTDDKGGICPMLAAHRNGGRTTLLAFARSWDAFAGSPRVRRATERELRILEGQLQASLLKEAGWVDLRAAIQDHVALKAKHDAAVEAAAEPEIEARRLTPGRVRGMRPRRDRDARRALQRLEAELVKV
jgi:hypothetical protein